MKSKRTFSERLSSRHELVIRNTEDLAEKSTFVFTYAKLLIVLVVVFVLFLASGLFLSKTILAKWFDPEYAQMQLEKDIYGMAMQLDSLTVEANRRSNFIKNLSYILSGDTTRNRAKTNDILGSEDSTVATIGDMEFTSLDSQFRKEFEQSEILLLDPTGSKYRKLRDVFFVPPIAGFVSDRYNPLEGRRGVKIITQANELVKAVADGTVLFSMRTRDFGYVVVVQHAGDLVSVYKNNADIFKKSGSFVPAGSVISIVDDGEKGMGVPHLYFELWYDGSPLNPEEFIAF